MSTSEGAFNEWLTETFGLDDGAIIKIDWERAIDYSDRRIISLRMNNSKRMLVTYASP